MDKFRPFKALRFVSPFRLTIRRMYFDVHLCFRFSSRLVHEVSVGDVFLLQSHQYSSNYPPNASVLWTFQYAAGEDPTNVFYQVSFGRVYLGYGDNLIVGTGLSPDNSTLSFAFTGYYNGYPRSRFYEAGHFFASFESDSYYERQGFRITLTVRNISGNRVLSFYVRS